MKNINRIFMNIVFLLFIGMCIYYASIYKSQSVYKQTSKDYKILKDPYQ